MPRRAYAAMYAALSSLAIKDHRGTADGTGGDSPLTISSVVQEGMAVIGCRVKYRGVACRRRSRSRAAPTLALAA